jgi:hypothetical protein
MLSVNNYECGCFGDPSMKVYEDESCQTHKKYTVADDQNYAFGSLYSFSDADGNYQSVNQSKQLELNSKSIMIKFIDYLHNYDTQKFSRDYFLIMGKFIDEYLSKGKYLNEFTSMFCAIVKNLKEKTTPNTPYYYQIYSCFIITIEYIVLDSRGRIRELNSYLLNFIEVLFCDQDFQLEKNDCTNICLYLLYHSTNKDDEELLDILIRVIKNSIRGDQTEQLRFFYMLMRRFFSNLSDEKYSAQFEQSHSTNSYEVEYSEMNILNLCSGLYLSHAKLIERFFDKLLMIGYSEENILFVISLLTRNKNIIQRISEKYNYQIDYYFFLKIHEYLTNYLGNSLSCFYENNACGNTCGNTCGNACGNTFSENNTCGNTFSENNVCDIASDEKIFNDWGNVVDDFFEVNHVNNYQPTRCCSPTESTDDQYVNCIIPIGGTCNFPIQCSSELEEPLFNTEEKTEKVIAYANFNEVRPCGNHSMYGDLIDTYDSPNNLKIIDVNEALIKIEFSDDDLYFPANHKNRWILNTTKSFESYWNSQINSDDPFLIRYQENEIKNSLRESQKSYIVSEAYPYNDLISCLFYQIRYNPDFNLYQEKLRKYLFKMLEMNNQDKYQFNIQMIYMNLNIFIKKEVKTNFLLDLTYDYYKQFTNDNVELSNLLEIIDDFMYEWVQKNKVDTFASHNEKIFEYVLSYDRERLLVKLFDSLSTEELFFISLLDKKFFNQVNKNSNLNSKMVFDIDTFKRLLDYYAELWYFVI